MGSIPNPPSPAPFSSRVPPSPTPPPEGGTTNDRACVPVRSSAFMRCFSPPVHSLQKASIPRAFHFAITHSYYGNIAAPELAPDCPREIPPSAPQGQLFFGCPSKGSNNNEICASSFSPCPVLSCRAYCPSGGSSGRGMAQKRHRINAELQTKTHLPRS